MRIVIDLQGAQTESRYRGIGRYSLSLAQAIVRNRGDHEIIIALNGICKDTIEPIRAAFYDLLPQDNIRVWYAPGPVRENEPGNTWRRQAAELIRESFIANLKPDVVHITSLFEGYVDDAVTSIGRFDQSTPVSVSHYDLIPLLNPEYYLKPNPTYEQYYLQKIDYLRRSSLLLSISEASKSEALDHFAQTPMTIANISTATDDRFRPLSLNDKQSNLLLDKFGITRPFVLYTGGSDERKNLPRLIRSYARLPTKLRNAHQLVFAGKMSEGDVRQLKQASKTAGLRSDELVFTGFINDDDLVKFYNLCVLYVFPSWHEGFGLPVLEAMSCGVPVIGANTSSVPEVIGYADALFDPHSEDDIVAKIEIALTNTDFRDKLRKHGIVQAKKFSWDKSAKGAIKAYEQLEQESQQTKPAVHIPPHRKKLAYISPLPPERTGIADYSAELIQELARHYDIEVIVAQDTISDTWIKANCTIRNYEWFSVNANEFDRVLYHFGNSPFHEQMFALLDKAPGTVVLHDFFLSGIQAYREDFGLAPNAFVRELYFAHGYAAVRELYQTQNKEDIKIKYPVNLSVLQGAQGIIVHSEYSRQLAKKWYGSDVAKNWAVIPLLRTSVIERERQSARSKLNLSNNDFIVCSFGFLDPTKLNNRLLYAWLVSNLAKQENCVLIFVGENHGGEYGQELLATIRRNKLTERIRITGWTDAATFRLYLVAANIGVQLRSLSRGETSAAVLDCMNYGLPTIVNANGSMADLPDHAVWKLPDEFSDAQLIEALETLWRDTDRRRKLGTNAQEVIATRHDPRTCACQYFDAIERFHALAQTGRRALIQALAALDDHHPNELECIRLAKSIAKNIPDRQPTRHLLLDISATCRNDLRTGIERVARALLLELINAPPEGYRVEPIYLTDTGGHWHYRYARAYTLSILGCPSDSVDEEEIEYCSGDVVLGLDLFCQGLDESRAYLDSLHRDGVKIKFLVFDLLPVLMQEMFPPGADEVHANWLSNISRYDGAICISKSVADDLTAWIDKFGSQRLLPFDVTWFTLGADIENSIPTFGMPDNGDLVLEKLRKRTSFLMVGTIEPRKGYLQTIAVFDELWKIGIDINLVIVGKEGWKGLSDDLRRTIPLIMERIRQHPELGKRLFWLDSISDEYLNKVFAASTCLIASSEGEGFGLPLIEAAQHEVPIIARDIPVFREVAGSHAHYYSGTQPNDLVVAIQEWLSLYESNRHPRSNLMSWLTWRQSAVQLLLAISDHSSEVIEKSGANDQMKLDNTLIMSRRHL